MEKSKIRIVALGDSTTAGTPQFLSPLEALPIGQGNAESQYAYWMMEAHPGWEVLNRGVNGERSDEILNRFQRDVLDVAPSYVIILGGVNDIYQGSSATVVEKNLLSMYRYSLDSEIKPVGATILPYNTVSESAFTAIKSVNEWVKSTAQSLRILFCDTYDAVVSPNDSRRLRGSPDGYHPDVGGYRRMGEALSRTIVVDLEAKSA